MPRIIIMNLKILNRDFQHPADGWYQIEALGNHPNRAAGIVQVIDQDAASSIVNSFNAEAAAGQLRHGNEMLIDHEHFSDQPDQETRAYGWLQELQNREDGIYGRIRWTATGKAAVDGGDYRFFSTEYAARDLEVVNKAGSEKRESGNKMVRPLRLCGLTLTNMNNNRGQKPITNRGNAASEALAGTLCDGASQLQNFATAGAAADSKQPTKVTNKKMKTVCTLLGLSADADEASVHAAVSKLLNRGDIAPDALATLRAEHQALSTANQTLLGEQLTGLLAEHGIKDAKIINRLTPILTPLKNREERLECLADFGFKPGGKETHGQDARATTRVLNRGGGSEAVASSEATAGADEAAVARKIKNRANELKGASPARTFDSCWKQAAQEVAEKV